MGLRDNKLLRSKTQAQAKNKFGAGENQPSPDEQLTRLEDDIRRLRIEFDIFFNGGAKKPPYETKGRVEIYVPEKMRRLRLWCDDSTGANPSRLAAPATLKPTINAPELLRNVRRENPARASAASASDVMATGFMRSSRSRWRPARTAPPPRFPWRPIVSPPRTWRWRESSWCG